MNIRETVSYIFILLFVALMFAFIFLTTGGGPFWRVFCICVIFSFSIGFINRGLCELTYPKVKNLELHFKIFLHIPLLFVGSFMGLIIANYICYLFFQSYPIPSQLIIKFGIGIGIFSTIMGSSLIFRTTSKEFEEQTKIARLEASIKSLQAQINPHFFFNSLASIQSLISKNPEKAEEALAAIAEVFRYSMRRGQKDFIELYEEILFIKQFLFIEKIRLGDRLKVIWNIDERLLHCRVPPFLIQPVVENAVKYGVEKQKKGRIKILIQEQDSKLNISVSNSAKAMVHLIPDHSLENIKKRIEAIYGKRGSFGIHTNKEVEVEILIPIQYLAKNRL